MAVPDFAIPDLEGNLHRLADFRGQVVVLNFWATWCPPCIDEMPSLQKLHQALSERGIAVVAISVDGDSATSPSSSASSA
jgi:peroxiredoxin